MAGNPGEQPDNQQDGDGKDKAKSSDKHPEKRPVAPGVATRLVEVTDEQLIVATVGLPGDVEDVTEKRNGADENADGEIGGHADQRDIGRAANPGCQRNDEGEQSGEDVAKTGNKADDSVEAETNTCAGNAECFVEQNLDAMQGAIAKKPRAAIPSIRGEHDRRRGFGIWAGHRHST
jgi:hypothetical protein